MDPAVFAAGIRRVDFFIKSSHINIIHFYRASDLTRNTAPHPSADLYLVDYELLNDKINGLDLIEKLKLDKHAFLVTSCFEEKMLRARCEKLGVKIIPKPFVSYIPILSSINTQIDHLVFIDNDDLMRKIWSLSAKKAGLNISTYASPNEFSSEINKHQKDTRIYIDSDLDNNIKGEQYAKHLYDLGFTELYLATGHPPEHFEHLPWIKLIVSKEPPFANGLDHFDNVLG